MLLVVFDKLWFHNPSFLIPSFWLLALMKFTPKLPYNNRNNSKGRTFNHINISCIVLLFVWSLCNQLDIIQLDHT